MSRKNDTEWIAWAGAALAGFAILEHQGIKHANGRRTLSYYVKGYTQRSKSTQAATVIGIASFASWLSWHFAYDPREI